MFCAVFHLFTLNQPRHGKQAGSDPLDENSLPPCKGDFDQDTDIDGSDLATYAAGGTTGVSLEEFTDNFGKASCP